MLEQSSGLGCVLDTWVYEAMLKLKPKQNANLPGSPARSPTTVVT
jgi:hypothetical protein